MIFDKEKLRKILIEEEEFADYEVGPTIEHLEKINQPQLQKCLDQWMEDQ